MDFIRALLGVNKRWPDQELATAITLFNNESAIPAFNPVIVSKKSLEKDENYGRGEQQLKIVNHFPTSRGTRARGASVVYKDSVIETESKGMFDRKIKHIDAFDFGKMPNILEFVKQSGVITFTMDDMKGARELFSRLHLFKQGFKHTSFPGHRSGSASLTSINSDYLTLAMTIYDLPFAIPVYNRKKANGIAVSMILFWPKYSEKTGQLKCKEEMNFLLNSHADNLLCIDGAKIRERGFPGSDYSNHYLKLLRSEEGRRKSAEKKLEKPKKKVPTVAAGSKMEDLEMLDSMGSTVNKYKYERLIKLSSTSS